MTECLESDILPVDKTHQSLCIGFAHQQSDKKTVERFLVSSKKELKWYKLNEPQRKSRRETTGRVTGRSDGNGKK